LPYGNAVDHVLVAVTAGGCRQQGMVIGETSGFAIHDTGDSLPDVMLFDEDGQKVSLLLLKRRPVLFDFM
jgi:hypothetical protein